VLEPLGGYLTLAARLAAAPPGPTPLASAFNFGPGPDANRTARELVEEMLRHWPGAWEDAGDPAAVHEAGLLQLSSDKAAALLGWRPVWSFAEAVRETVRGYRAAAPEELAAVMREQIGAYIAGRTS
jgi:CDP-glucose 4,6-dehydratase